MLNKSNITWNAKQVVKMMSKGLLQFNNVVQRSYVWEKTRKSDFIHSMIEGWPTTAFFARRVDGKIYDFLDGKQRMNTIYSYINNEYYLVGVNPVEDEEGNLVEIAGKTFDELPEEFQDRIYSYSLTIYYFENITDEQVRILFKKLNNGKPLSVKERNIANCVDIVNVSNIGEHEFFKEVLTDSALDKRAQIPMVMKFWTMLNEPIENISFLSKDFNEVIQETEITAEEKEEIITILNKYLAVYNLLSDKKDKDARKKLKTEVHMVSLVPFFKEAVRNDISDEMMADFIRDTFNNSFVSDEYKAATRDGASKNSAIVTRNKELRKAWDEFFAEDTTETEEEVKEFKYGMRLRGFAPMCQPMDGFLRREDDPNGKYHDVIVYSRELTDEELEQYELDEIL